LPGQDPQALRQHLLSIATAALRAVGGESATTRALAALPVLPALREASRHGRLLVIAAGKPSAAMIRGLLNAGLVPAHGLIATPFHDEDAARQLEAELLRQLSASASAARHGSPGASAETSRAAAAGTAAPAWRFCFSGHPVPTAASVEAGEHALALAHQAAPDDHLLVLLSGGASALLAAPADGLTLDDKMRATRALLGGGAAIHELNGVRKHLSAIKGGRLAAAARCQVTTLAISDVISPVDDDPSVIGSGPTVPDASTYADALASIDRLGVREAMPAAVLAVLEDGAAGRRDESPKPGDPRLARAGYRVIASRRDAMAAARAEAERLGFTVFVVDDAIAGEAREAAPRLLARADALVRDRVRHGPCCVIASGETTVRVTGSGRGGRNQEFALALVERLAAPPGATPHPSPLPASGAREQARGAPWVVAASIGTDGIDGPTDAAGGMVDSTTLRRARAAGAGEPSAFLANNDAYRFLDAVGDLIKTGPTDTNVGDLQILVYNPH
jgi:glycerate 2-kinase